MGRRALRKPDPSLDLSGHLKTWEELPHPFDSAALFRRTAPLEVEVGTGKGLFLLKSAQGRPDRNYLGIEIAHKYARFTASRLARHQLTNAVIVNGDALRLFSQWLADASISAVHVYFPDPWWKKRHHKRRIMRPAFCRDIQRVLLPGGRLHFWTDVEAYFELSLKTLAESTQLQGPLPVPQQLAEHDMDYRTHFERRMRTAGKPIHRSEFVKPHGDQETGRPGDGATRRRGDQETGRPGDGATSRRGQSSDAVFPSLIDADSVFAPLGVNRRLAASRSSLPAASHQAAASQRWWNAQTAT